MKKLIRLTESDLHRIIENSVRRVISEGRLNEKIDDNLLDGVEYIDDKSVRSIIEKMIPANNRSMKGAEYQPIRQLVMYFNPKNGIARHGSLTDKQVATYILGGSFLGKNNKFAIKNDYIDLCKEDQALFDTIYGTVRKETRRGVVNTKLQGTDLIEQVGWHIHSILKIVQRIIGKLKAGEVNNTFGHIDGIKGYESGKIKGLHQIVIDAGISVSKIQDVMDKLQELCHNGYDPLSYRTSGRRW
jgi:hypothetical protein